MGNVLTTLFSVCATFQKFKGENVSVFNTIVLQHALNKIIIIIIKKHIKRVKLICCLKHSE